MYNISQIADLSQLGIGRSLRSNAVLLMYVQGLNKVEDIDFIKYYSSKCEHIYYNKGIEKPTYDETQELLAKLTAYNNFNINTVKSDVATLFFDIGTELQQLISDSVFDIFREVQVSQKASGFKNSYICTLNILLNRLNGVVSNLKNENAILYVGRPDKFEVLAFSILGLAGVDIVILNFEGLTIESLCQNRFVYVNGEINKDVDLSFLAYTKLGVKNIDDKTVVINKWVDFSKCNTMEDYLSLMNFRFNDRLSKNKWCVLNVCLNGIDDINQYSSLLCNFRNELIGIPRPFEIVNNGFDNASYDETQEYNKKYAQFTLSELFANYPLFNGSGVPIQIEKIFDTIERSGKITGSKLKNHLTVLKIWLIRLLNKFYTSNALVEMPILLYFGTADEKDRDFLKIVSILPMDILCINPNFVGTEYSITLQVFNVGRASTDLIKFPENAGATLVSTVAYNAEQELDTILYNDNTLFRIKQFKKINPIVLKTTYDEIGILWHEPAKMRPSFNSSGNVVTVPTLFAKIDGVSDNYRREIERLYGSNTIVYDLNHEFQLVDIQYHNTNSTLRDFAKQLVFKGEVDYERLYKSRYYGYSVYSDETQELIREKVDKLIHMSWCVGDTKGLAFDIIDTVFRLPPEILQKLHNYDFTAQIPKVVVYNGTNMPCSNQLCIALMFLSLVGFDILVLAPTGYRVIEHYINSSLFNQMTVGEYNFNIADLNYLQSAELNQPKKKGFWQKILG